MTAHLIGELEDELNERKEKVNGLKDLIKDKKAEYREVENQKVQRKTFQQREEDLANNQKYAAIMNELDDAKIEILKLKEKNTVSSLGHSTFEKRAP